MVKNKTSSHRRKTILAEVKSEMGKPRMSTSAREAFARLAVLGKLPARRF